MVAMSKQAGLYDQRDGDFEGSSAAFMVDSACISASGLFFGTSPCTPFVGKLRSIPYATRSLMSMGFSMQNPHLVSRKVERLVLPLSQHPSGSSSPSSSRLFSVTSPRGQLGLS